MDPIHPIVPVTRRPAQVDAVRPLARTGEDPREPRKAPAPDPELPGVTADGHLDTRA
jgi:hypothetical protein